MTQNKSKLEWIDETIPLSKQFDDTYYSKADGYAETKHTFLDGNNLKERFQETDTFMIAELGFGTGLNYLAAKRLWQEMAPKNAILNFISFEQYPLSAEEIIKSLSRWPELGQDALELTQVWKPNSDRLEVTISNSKLLIYFGDANERIPKLNFQADAWFLDGFSPAKNPELWNENLMHQVARLTKQNGTFATYTSAGFVRRNLNEAGFKVAKVSGHAGKREMSIGIKSD